MYASMQVRFLASFVAVAVLLGTLVLGTSSSSLAQGDCPEGSVLSDNGVTCEPDVGQNDTEGDGTEEPPANGPINGQCPEGSYLDGSETQCLTLSGCPAGQQMGATGCEDIPGALEDSGDDEKECEDGLELGADGETCIAVATGCGPGEAPADDGSCIVIRRCEDGMILAADLLTCVSDRCPEGELASADGSRCVAPDSSCPDGSPRPVGGACLVVDRCGSDDDECSEGEVKVRCDVDDLFCQALVKQCAEDKASGGGGDENCEDPRGSCADDDEGCAEANDRLVECAQFEELDAEEQEARRDVCDDLCPALHTLDASGECVEYLDPRHPCVSFGRIPRGVTTNAQLNNYSYLAGTGQCVTRTEFLRRLANFEAAAGAEADALALLRETTSEYLTVEEQLADLETRLKDTEAQVVDFKDKAGAADVRRVETEKRLSQTRVELAKQQKILREEVVEFFVTGGEDAAIASAILNAESLSELGVTLSYSRAVLGDQVATLEDVVELEAETAELVDDLQASVAQAEETLDEAVNAQGALEQLLNEVQVLQAEQEQRRADEAAIVADLRADKAVYAQELGVFEQASREIADIISESEFLVENFADFDGLLAEPVIPAIAGSGFGPRLHPILGYVRNHDGVDFSANFGDHIYASAPGIVQIASVFGGYGNTVVLDHGGGLLTLYAHMSTIAVDPGAEVERGAIIGLIGSTGLSTGPHLHFEVWVEGNQAVDPLPYLTAGGNSRNGADSDSSDDEGDS